MKLEEIRKLIEAATPGPWPMINLENAAYHLANGLQGPRTFEDAIFIAAARTLMPKLLAVAREARNLAEIVDENYSIYFKAVDVLDALAALESD